MRIKDPECRVRLQENTIISNGEVGVLCTDGCSPRLARNTISAHDCGLIVRFASQPIVHGNTISNNTSHAAILHDNASGDYFENVFMGGSQAVMKVASGAHPSIISNDISDGTFAGVLVIEGGVGSFERNRIHNNLDGVVVQLFAVTPISRRISSRPALGPV